MRFFKHELSDVQATNIGDNTKIWQFVVVLPGAYIGKNCNLNAGVFIENDVFIGDNVTIKCGVQIWDGVSIENDVFIGPNVTFVNHKTPRSKLYPVTFQKTFIKNNVSIGANATILGGLTIGSFALVGAGSVVTKSVPSRALVLGNPGKIVGWVNENGTKMLKNYHVFVDDKGVKWREYNNELILEHE
jgi:acetyltransferase-like isoleucine patch superfamily enzyme